MNGETFVFGQESCLPSIEGVDLVHGLAAVGQNHRVYRRLLKLFCDNHRSDARLLGAALGRGAFDEAAVLAHRLRGGALTLGIFSIDGLASTFEASIIAGRSQQAREQDLLALSDALAQVVAAIEAALNAT